jgi:tubulin epsilon
MESGVIDKKILGGDLKDIFDSRQTITDAGGSGAGSGNNWAQGHMEYGPKYKEDIEEKVRQ